jgi:hypothetical protein
MTPDISYLNIMRSFRISTPLNELIKQECKRRNTDFSAFIRLAVLSSVQNRPNHSEEVTA